MNSVPSLRDLHDAGTRPADMATVYDLQHLAEKVTTYDKEVGPRPFPLPQRDWLIEQLEDADLDERLQVAWEIEIADDPAIRAWFFDQLPADIRAEAVMAQDEADRPFPLEATVGPFHCSSCGRDCDGRHIEVIIRDLAVAYTGIEIKYCRDCIHAVASEADQGGA